MGAVSTRNAEPERASRPFDIDRDGFVFGEGAGVLVLESEDHARARGAVIQAELAGYGTTADAYHISAPASDGSGAALAMRNALAKAGARPDEVDYINAHGTGTPLNDVSETRAIKLALGEHAYHVPISSTKSMHGHCLGASGAVEMIACLHAVREGVIAPTINLHTPAAGHDNPAPFDVDLVPNHAKERRITYAMNNTFGFGGHNCSLIVGRYE